MTEAGDSGGPGGEPLTLGTAGHIDHGKTALIRALTGVDTDRLPEEHARGISIELGYAPLVLPSGRRLSVVDVPGHERFVRTMVAGATGIDLFLMVVAADDGVMPQTREHAAVLRGLGVGRGVLAVNKADLASPAPAQAELARLLPEAEAVAVSARTGAGIDDLRRALDRMAADTPSRAGSPGPTRLHVDRSFSVRGAGTVVTGTLWAGRLRRGDRVVVLPDGRRSRIRGLQVHDQAVEEAAAGQRVAVNLAGVERSAVQRGDVVVAEGAGVEPSWRLDAALEFDPGADRPEHGARVQVHHGTREAPARLADLGGRFWQVRLERPLLPVDGDRLVIRQIAPPDTLGGGVVLDGHPGRHGAGREVTARLTRRLRGEAEPDAEPAPATPAEPDRAKPITNDRAPLSPLSDEARALEARLRGAWFEPPIESELTEGEVAVLAELRRAGRAVRVSRTLHYHPEALAEVQRRVASAIEASGSITLATLRDELGTSRKFAQALLEHLDSERVTRRLAGDERVLRKGAR